MVDWQSNLSGNRFGVVGEVSGSSRGTLITANSTPGFLGAWSQLTASVPVPVSGLTVAVNSLSATVHSCHIDLGFGTAGSEMVVVPNMLHSAGAIPNISQVFHFPIRIPEAVRLAARMASSTGSATAYISAVCNTLGWATPIPSQRVVSWGQSASARGVSVDPGSSANTKGSWTQITAGTTETAQGLMIGLGNGLDTSRAASSWLIDIGVGASGSETIIIPDYAAYANASEMVEPGLSPVFPVILPFGTRLAARAQASVTTASDRLIDVMLYSIV